MLFTISLQEEEGVTIKIKLSKKAELNVRSKTKDQDKFQEALSAELEQYEVDLLEAFHIIMKYKGESFHIKAKEQAGIIFIEEVTSLYVIEVD